MNEYEPKNVVLIGAHVDDELLTMGGALMNHLGHDKVHILIITEREDMNEERMREVYAPLIRKYGLTITTEKNLRDQMLDVEPECRITGVIEEYLRPICNGEDTIVYTHSENDMNIDHRIVARATKIACRPYGNVLPNKPIAVYGASPINANGFSPNYFIRLSKKEVDEMKMLVSKYDLWNRHAQGLDVKLMSFGMLCGECYAEGFEVIYQKV